jgi:predicted acylesterase/phospholipase RssA
MRLQAILLSLACCVCALAEPPRKPYDLNGDGRVVGLALSGGGLRATGLGYGALLELVDQGLMDRVDLISAVSGGSIVGAYYCLGLPLDQFGPKLNKNLFTTSLEKVLNPKNLFNGQDDSRATGFAEALDDVLYGKRKLVDLTERPYLLINAVNIETTSLFVFTRERAACENLTGNDGLRYYQLEADNHTRLRVSEAVTASSCVPSVLNPVELDVVEQGERKGRNKASRRIRLMDGGLFDNLGLEALLQRKCDAVIAVDASYSVITKEGYAFFAPGGTKVIPITRLRYRGLLCLYARDRLADRFVHLKLPNEEVEVSPLKTKLEKGDLEPLVAHGRELVKENLEQIRSAMGCAPEPQKAASPQ